MIVQYVNDCEISAPTQGHIDCFVEGLKGLNLELTQEGTFEEFLGIKFKYHDNGMISIVITLKIAIECKTNTVSCRNVIS